jgi:2-polyprenyl-3-methyl-5-hydroxy-6-metoxy-1,4-benzoquinol methylase
MEWFEEWFNSKEYLSVYRHRDEKEATELTKLIVDNINIPHGSKVLDMAAGSGRHALIFAKNGFNVTAVDLSKNLLSIGEKKAAEDKINIRFIHSDIRQFKSDKKFDLILNLFTSIGYFEKDEENFDVLVKAFQLLNDNGYFVLDYLNKYFVENNLTPSSVDKFNGTIITQHRFIDGNRILKEITIDKKGEINKYLESVRMFSDNELLVTLQKIGFRVKKIFGDIKGNSFKLESSPRIIIIAGK